MSHTEHKLYDVIIGTIILGGSAAIVLLLTQGEVTLIKQIIAGVVGFGVSVIFYGSFIEPRLIRHIYKKIDIVKTPSATLRIALISDIHVGTYKKQSWVAHVAKRVVAQKPDIIIIAGDLISICEEEVPYLLPLKNLSAPLGVFAVLGNHDYGLDDEHGTVIRPHTQIEAIEKMMKETGVHLLLNEAVDIKKEGAHVTLVGLDEWWTENARMPKTAASRPRIVVTHNPDAVKIAAPVGVELVLAGHTHGGQIRLPFLGPVPRIPDDLGQHFDRGLFQYTPTTKLFITSGIGESGARARLFVPPEIVILEVGI